MKARISSVSLVLDDDIVNWRTTAIVDDVYLHGSPESFRALANRLLSLASSEPSSAHIAPETNPTREEIEDAKVGCDPADDIPF